MRELGSSQPTAVELEILRILWELGPSPVRQIHARLAEAKGTNYSTTVKMLSVMLTKGLVKRDEQATPLTLVMKKIKVHSLTGRIAPELMRKAFQAVKRNRGAAGVDKVSIQMFAANLEENLAALTPGLG